MSIKLKCLNAKEIVVVKRQILYLKSLIRKNRQRALEYDVKVNVLEHRLKELGVDEE